jgi:hypothetical protein
MGKVIYKILTRVVDNNRTRHQNTEANNKAFNKAFKSQIEFEVNARSEYLRIANNPMGEKQGGGGNNQGMRVLYSHCACSSARWACLLEQPYHSWFPSFE